MKIVVLIPESVNDENVRNCLNEIIRQTNIALDGMDKKIEELRSVIYGKSDN